MKSIVTVANRLPITVGETIQKSSGGLVSAMQGIADDFALKWVGWAGGQIKNGEKQKKMAEEIRERFQYTPIFLSDADAADYYNGFSNSSLWPLLHYMTAYGQYDDRWWAAYQRVNAIFADAVSDTVGGEEIVWIHDYHLMLLPAILRQRAPHLKIGFFLHTPFPSSEIFRCHPNRKALIEGLLGADLIGFQTFGYLRHFRSTVLRVLGIESEVNCIERDTHMTSLGVYPIGINSAKFSKEMKTETYRKYLSEYRDVYRGKYVFLSVERLDYTKGIPRRLDAIEKFLDRTERVEDVVFIFISVPSRESVEDYQNLVEEVEGRIGQINGKYSTIKNIPLHFIHKSVEFSQLCALYSLADACLVTPVIDGMNLVAKEYVACREEKNGVLILSEFAGAAQELPNALIVNPYDIDGMARGMEQAVVMTEEEKIKRMAPMKERVMKYDAMFWAEAFLKDLQKGKTGSPASTVPVSISLKSLDRRMESGAIALFLDYDGTLAELERRPADAYPRGEILTLFSRLKADNGIDTYIVSGRKSEDMDEWFSPYGFTLIAEDGYCIKDTESRRWRIFDDRIDLSWMNQMVDIFGHYTGMTPGSSMEVKTSSVVWHYREADPEFGRFKANQLVSEIYDLLANLPAEINHGKKIVEVCSTQNHKGMVMEDFVSRKAYDLVLCAGDDETDESMFRSSDSRIVSIKVGEGDTAAQYRIGTPREFRAFLSELIGKRTLIPG